MVDRRSDPLAQNLESSDPLSLASRSVLDGLHEALANAEDERERLMRALERTSTELHELLVELDALRRARAAAESTNLVRGEILATVSRTMRTPADALLGLTGLLRMGALLPTQRAYVEALHGASESLRGILNDVSDYSRLESGTLPLEPIPFDLRVMVEDMAMVLGAQAQAKGLTLHLAWRPDAPRRVTGDPGRIRQVLTALIRDGFGRLERGDILIEVAHGGMRGPESGIRVAIEDSGPAIPADLLPTLFEPFTRGDAYSAREGNLGLPIARHLTHLMGGDLMVENLEQPGSRFTVRLPLPKVDGSRAEPAAEPMQEATPTLAMPGTLLVVEADANQRSSWAAIAEAAGYRTSAFGSREEAVGELRQRAAAGLPASIVIFSDHDADGYDGVGREIVGDDALGRPALIMLPAVGNPGDARRLQGAGFRAYLVKPVAPADLRETLETLRRTPRGSWHTLFVTRHWLAEARSGGDLREAEVNASLEQLIGSD